MLHAMSTASATSMPSGRTAFVTGATGFVGANLIRLLLRGGWRVRALVRSGSELSNLAGVEVEIVEGSLLDPAGLRQTVQGCDVCFHAAAAISAGDPSEAYRTNVEGTKAVLSAAASAGCSAIVHVSTMGTLGRADGRPARETDSWLSPAASDYVKSKFQGEVEARAFAARGAPVIIVHPSAPVGAFDKGPTVTGRRIVEVLEGRLPRWIAGAINHVAVRDVAAGMVLAAERGRPGQSYLLANAEGNLTRAELVALVARAAAMAPPRERQRSWLDRLLKPSRRSGTGGGPQSLACDPTWSVQELGLPQTPLAEAFGEAVEWFRKRTVRVDTSGKGY